MKKTGGFLLLVVCSFVLASRCATTACETANYIIPYEQIDKAFDKGIEKVRSQDNLIALIQNPNTTTIKNYLLSLAPFAAPLFVMAGITFVVFIATIVQVICFNTCSKECCGNEITSTTYNVCCIRMLVFTYLFFSFLVLCLSIASMIVNSDLQKALDYTTCNTQNIINETYTGNTNSTIPWSGSNNFEADINIFAASIQNSVPFLINYFSSTPYNEVTDNTAGSYYANSQIFTSICTEVTSVTVSCPFESSSVCTTSPYNPTFNQQFCDPTAEGSAANLIAAEMADDSSTWRDNIILLQGTLTNINTDAAEVDTLVTEVTDFTTSLSNYQSNLDKGFLKADQVNHNIEIAFYVFFSFIIACCLLGMTSLCCAYYCLNYSCKFFMYFLWYIYALLAFLLFITAGLFLAASFFTFDTCTAYPYYFQNATNFKDLTFSSDQLGSIFETCFFLNSTSIFAAFTDTTILNQFGQLNTQYNLAVPPTSFYSVVTTIENTMNTYRQNPNQVTIFNAPSEQQPQVAMDALNTFGNSSLANTTQSCKITQDFFTFDVANCGEFLVDQPTPQDSCIVLSAQNISAVITARVNAFNPPSTTGCETDGTTYNDMTQSMINFGQTIGQMVDQLSPITIENVPIQQYEASYFEYYTQVRNFFNNEVQQTFESFFTPYLALQEGSSCGFVKSSMDGIVNIGCNQLFPYINIFSSLNIAASVFVFFLFVISYFLTTRLNFYEFLEGNYENFGVETHTTKELQQAYDFDTGRQIELLPNGDRIY